MKFQCILFILLFHSTKEQNWCDNLRVGMGQGTAHDKTYIKNIDQRVEYACKIFLLVLFISWSPDYKRLMNYVINFELIIRIKI